MRRLLLLTVLIFPFALQARPFPVADPQMIYALKQLAPALPGWVCIVPDPDPGKALYLRYLPAAVVECSHEESTISLTIHFDPEFGTMTCAARNLRKQSEGKDIGETVVIRRDTWISERTGSAFKACSTDQVVVLGTLKSQPAAPGDQNTVELFHEALIVGDPAPVLALAAESKARLDEAFSIVRTQTYELDQLLPRPEGWEVSDSLLSMMERLEARKSLSLTAITRLIGYPTAGHTLSRGNCRIVIALSAAPEALHDAEVTFANPKMKDGLTGPFWRNRNTDRLHGQEAVDGSRFQVVVDRAVALVINASNDCSHEEGIATSIYETIIDEDLSRFRRE